MARKKMYIGSLGPILWDDADPIDDQDGDFAGFDRHAFVTDGQMIVEAYPSEDYHLLRKIDLEDLVHPVGSIYLSVDPTNPNTLFGFGTWALVSQGQYLAGFKSGDPNFGVAAGTGGSLTSGTPSATAQVDNNLDSSTVNVGDATHTHDILPPYFTIYVWHRTA